MAIFCTDFVPLIFIEDMIVKYNIELQKRNNVLEGDYPINLRIGSFRRSTGLKSKISHWDKRSQNVNSKHPKYASVHKYLQGLHSKIELTMAQNPTAKAKTIWNLLIYRNPDTPLNEFIQDYINEQERTKKFGNARYYRTFLGRINVAFGHNMPSVSEINSVLVADFKTAMLENGVNNGVNNYLRSFKRIYHYAIEREIILPNPVSPFKGKIKSSKPIHKAISSEEIGKLRNLILEPYSRKDRVRDIFLCMFNLQGMNWVDIVHLTTDVITKPSITYVRRKLKGRGEPITVAITDEARKIFKKYEGKGNDDFLFPVISQDKEKSERAHNQYLTTKRNHDKELVKVGEMVGIDKLTGYVARHSWATIADQLGVNIRDIQDSMGHTSRTTTEIYINNIRKEERMDINERISKGV